MNIIEKYGSCDAAKAKQQELSKIAADPQLLLVGKIIKEIGEIEMALLEYRRQHNIFEHGDKIIVDWDSCQIFTVDLVFPEIRLISALDSSGNKVGNASFGRIKHATDEEIKAGRRL